MGITGLLPFLKKTTRPGHLREFSGCTAAVDVYVWLHKGAFGCAEKLVRDGDSGTDGYILYVMKFVDLLLYYNIKPILVFDGRNLPSKAATEKKRRENREKYRKLAKDYLRDGNIKEARECFQRCIDITPNMARNLIRACRERNIDCIVAPYEADAQLAFLNTTGQLAHLVISEDSDLTTFGCNKILFKLDINGNGLLYEKDNLSACLGQSAESFTFEKFRYMTIMAGCDYLPSLHGIGIAKSLKFWKRISNLNLRSALPKIPSYLNMAQLQVTQEYIDGFIQANNTFLYQLIYDPTSRTLRPLTEYPSDIKQHFEYTGEMIDSELAFQMAFGNIDLRTLDKVDNFDPKVLMDNQRVMDKNKFKPKYGRKTNHPTIWSGTFNKEALKKNQSSGDTLTPMSSTTRGEILLAKTAFSTPKSNKKKSPIKTIEKNQANNPITEIKVSKVHLDTSPIFKSNSKKRKHTSESDDEDGKDENKRINCDINSIDNCYDKDNEVASSYTEIKKKFNFDTMKEEVTEKTITISKYFTIDTNDKGYDRRLERGRNPGKWLSSIEDPINHEGKLIYRADSNSTTSNTTTTNTNKAFKPVIENNQNEEENTSMSKRNPFIKKIKSSPTSETNLKVEKVKMETNDSSVIPEESSLKENQRDVVSPVLIPTIDSPVKSPSDEKLTRSLSSSYSTIMKKITPSCSSSQSSYFNKTPNKSRQSKLTPHLQKGVKPSGLMKKPNNKQKSILDMWGKKK